MQFKCCHGNLHCGMMGSWQQQQSHELVGLLLAWNSHGAGMGSFQTFQVTSG